ncbi:leucyl/phenylalanyl-tRNA--protein transferase [Sulfuriferula multivorans]|uniref:Leucyl/phenylalanyl-tRNA--protein transferase n=1 Tax=Sulfuriferula multivorans TaxID=1559896 RepID=A0A401JAP7_9PROT|nr:leucyl/phenylalanyl-tRNA--protein transferase [Sulfuriferula multivorans]GBL44713.1 leucyl/phenylalanyl-tRNA--protein transferase [Sulfuriferula multivorans]
MLTWLSDDEDFPAVCKALRDPDGLLAAGGVLSPARLVDAYSRGIFPWYNPGDPILWWSPDPRMVLFPQELVVQRSLAKVLRKRHYEIRVDTVFAEVIAGCSKPRAGQSGTWISAEMIAAYTRLHQMGVAHSIETWIDGRLAGGLYGIALGRAFYGESMFTLVPDASKIAFVHLVRQLQRWDFGVIDCQMNTPHLARFGAREIPRADFIAQLNNLINLPAVLTPWRFDHDLIE